jgi:hypothetical protein
MMPLASPTQFDVMPTRSCFSKMTEARSFHDLMPPWFLEPQEHRDGEECLGSMTNTGAEWLRQVAAGKPEQPPLMVIMATMFVLLAVNEQTGVTHEQTCGKLELDGYGGSY